MTVTPPSDIPPNPDFGMSALWGDRYWDHFNTFRQGHLLVDIPVVFFGSTETPLWAAETESARDDVSQALYIAVEKGTPLRYGMITTQGCDILRPDMPWIGVVPVYDAALHFDRGKLGLIGANRMTHILPIKPPWREESQKWVADLRLEVPVEKTVLLGREPIEAYEDDEEYAAVAVRLGTLRQRAAVPESCINSVIQPLYDYVRAQDQSMQEHLLSSVNEVRIWQDHHDVPSRAQLFLLLKDELASTHDHEAWDPAFDYVYASAAEAGITLLPTKTETYDSLSARDLLRTLPVNERGTS